MQYRSVQDRQAPAILYGRFILPSYQRFQRDIEFPMGLTECSNELAQSRNFKLTLGYSELGEIVFRYRTLYLG